ncbi:MAG TPA: hypothetical protein PKY81_09185 [bacterium]|nr:hypothetical protein [bacterium]
MQPTFLLPYKQYIFSIVYMCIVGGNSIRESIEKKIITSINISYKTVQHWIRGIKSTASKWINLLQSENENKCRFEN